MTSWWRLRSLSMVAKAASNDFLRNWKVLSCSWLTRLTVVSEVESWKKSSERKWFEVVVGAGLGRGKGTCWACCWKMERARSMVRSVAVAGGGNR